MADTKECKWLSKYPEIETSTREIAKRLRGVKNRDHLELEARLGLIQHPTTFSTGVTRTTMDGILYRMQKSPYLKGNDEWIEQHDFFFEKHGLGL